MSRVYIKIENNYLEIRNNTLIGQYNSFIYSQYTIFYLRKKEKSDAINIELT